MNSVELSGAARQVSNTLGLARQYAITHHTTTRVVFPYSGTVGVGTNLAPLYQSYAVYDLGAASYVSKWEHLPLGAVFMNVNASVGTPPSLDGLQKDNAISFPTTKLPLTP